MTVSPFAFLPESHLWLTLFVIVEWAIRIVMLIVVPFRRTPDAAKGWLLLILFEPVVGAALYFVFGRRRIPKWRLERAVAFAELARPVYARLSVHPNVTHPEQHGNAAPAVRLAEKLGDLPILGGNNVEILSDYDVIVDRLVADVDAARSHVHMLFYIIADDAVAERVIAALKRAVKRGVVCRVMADALGSRRRGYDALMRRLHAAGIEAGETMRLRFFRRPGARADLRNHRKIVVIDGRIGYTGSMNLVSADFISGLTYEELMVRVTGPIALELQAVFVQDWYLERGRSPDAGDPFPDPDVTGSVAAQVLPSSPIYSTDNSQRLIVALVSGARTRAIITTPYFIPDQPLLQALTTAALRGVDVRLVVPAQDDQLLVSNAQKSYYGELLGAGVRICRYGKRFLHAKHATIDDDIAWIGSSNMDLRSFSLNAEIVLLAYDRDVCAQIAEVQERYFRDGEWLDAETWGAQPFYRQVGWNLARLFAPLL